MIPECFPTDVRGIGSGFITSFGRIGGIMSPVITNFILQLGDGNKINITILAIIFMFCGLSVLPLKETKPKKINT